MKSFTKIRLRYSILKIFGKEHLLDKRKKLIPENAIIIDCGAHDGLDSINFAKLLPKSTIHAIEPVPHIYEKLKNNTKVFKNINTYNIAISDKQGEVTINISEGTSDASSSLLQPKEHLKTNPNVYFLTKVSVTSETFDTWCKKYNISDVDFMWLDMQGYELAALKNAPEVLEKCKVIYTEVSKLEEYKDQGLYKDLLTFLNGKGFIVYKEFFDDENHGDVLFIKTLNTN
jgi:FkbM family methyltransferase